MPAYLPFRPLSCPRCDAEATVELHGDAFAVICSATLCRLIGPRRPTSREAVSVWNTRTVRTQQPHLTTEISS